MKTETDITIWATSDTDIKVTTGGQTAWALIGGAVTVHSLDSHSVTADLDALETFFQKGLDAVQVARQGQLFNDLAGK